MGSFANSLHVKCADAATVAEIVRDALLAEGYEPTDEELDEEAQWGFSATLRAIQLSASRDGWVSLLDSDMGQSLTLAAQLSKQLETHSLQVWVNDSDFWHYQLYDAGQLIDEFNSPGSEEFEDGGVTNLEDIFGEGQLTDLQRSIQESAQELEQQLQELLPADLKDVPQRWKAGQATPEEIQKYTQWIVAEAPRLMEGFQGLLAGLTPNLPSLGGLTPNFPPPGQRPTDEVKSRSHVVQLKPLLKAGVSEERVREILGTQDVFAEGTLGDFLPLIGIASRYAYLSYRYLGEYSAKDLATHSIRLEYHLKFKKPAQPHIVR